MLRLLRLNLRISKLLLFLTILFSTSFAQSVDPSFYPVISKGSAIIYSTIVQPDQKILLGGLFWGANGENQISLARLNSDGSLDTTFSVSVLSGSDPGTVYDMKLLADNKILFVGNFQSVNGQTRKGIARINSDGSLDNTLSNVIFNNTSVYSVGLQANGKMIVGGAFSTANSVTVSGLVRLNTDGSLDSSFVIPKPSNVNSVADQPDDKILIGGRFGEAQATPRNKIARLNADGTLDTTFLNGMSGASDDVSSVSIQSDGKVLVAGFFNTINGVSRKKFARLNTDGSVDLTFQNGMSGVDRDVLLLKQLPNGQILIGGTFGNVNGIARDKVAKLNSDGSVDASFSGPQFYEIPPPTQESLAPRIYSGALTADGSLIAAGSFQQVNGVLRQHITRLGPDGVLDTGFKYVYLETQGTVAKIARQSDGKILIAGDFRFVNGVQSYNLGRINADGTLDPSFKFPFNIYPGFLDQIRPLPDGKILIAGSFSIGSPVPAQNIARLNSDGSVDTAFQAGVSCCAVYAFTVQPDGKIVIGGYFSYVSNQPRNGIARLNPDGSLDPVFQSGLSGVNGYPYSLLTQSDGRILLGGSFSTVNSAARKNLARLQSDGTLDSTFVANKDSQIRDLELQPDGKILVAESKLFVNEGRNRVSRLNMNGADDPTFLDTLPDLNGEVLDVALQSDGRILFVGNFNSVGGSSRRIARLLTDGTFDPSFPAYDIGNFTNPHIEAVLVEPNGNLLFGGSVGKVNGIARSGLFRVTFNHARSDFDDDGKTDIAVWREQIGTWFSINSSNGAYSANQFGAVGDKIVPGDYDGDGKADIAVWRPSNGTWYINGSAAGFSAVQFGLPADLPAQADFDGDGKTDIAVFRPSNGTWYLLQSTAGFAAIQFGTDGDKAVAGDYDGDGKADIAVFRPSDGNWYQLRSAAGFVGIHFGIAADKIVPADFDGDGKTDLAVFRDGTWFLQQSSAGFSAVTFGLPDDIPVPGDYDGDGKSDVAVFRPSDGNWYLLQSTSGYSSVHFGTSGDKPTPSAFVY